MRGGPVAGEPEVLLSESRRALSSAIRFVFGGAHHLDDVVAEPEPIGAQTLEERCHAVDPSRLACELEDAHGPDHRRPETSRVAAGGSVVEHHPFRADGERQRNGLALAGTQPVRHRAREQPGCGLRKLQDACLDRLPDCERSGSVRPALRRLREHRGRDERPLKKLGEQVQKVEVREREQRARVSDCRHGPTVYAAGRPPPDPARTPRGRR